ncbi:MAG: hypothetical protein HY684_06270 [Chloroflexi bacterium]|nr:hypothetical protein [Chloroflexota bacterium]
MFAHLSTALASVAGPGSSPYVDPTAGGILLQVVLGGITGILVLVRLSWRRLVAPFRRKRKATPANPEVDSPRGS